MSYIPTPRERAVLAEIAVGKTNKEIARCTSYSLSSVRTTVAKLMNKTSAPNRAALATYACLGVIPVPNTMGDVISNWCSATKGPYKRR